jgi:hypothetical protein
MCTAVKAGGEDALGSTSKIGIVDGRQGQSLYGGFDTDDFVARSTREGRPLRGTGSGFLEGV